VSDHAVLHLPDGQCAALDPAGPVATITELLEDRRPDTVVTFGPDGVTGHADHRAVSSWVSQAVAGRGRRRPRLLHAAMTQAMAAAEADMASRYAIYEPGLPVTVDEADLAVRLLLDESLLDTKVRALRAHATQTAALEAAVGSARYRAWVATECFVESPSDHGVLRARRYDGEQGAPKF
jgi:LmbE family N-acetylglucosaminyl deacetylase